MVLYDDATIEQLKRRLPDYLRDVCGITDLRRPFRCLHPAHDDKNPSMSYDPRTNRVKCFSCDASGDILDVVGWVEDITEYPEQVQAAAGALAFPLQANSPTKARKPAKGPRKPSYSKPKPLEKRDLFDKLQPAMFSLLAEPQGKIALDILHNRGFTDDEILDAFLGWVKHPSELYPDMKAPKCDAGYIALGFPDPYNVSPVEEVPNYHYLIPYAVFRPCKTDAQPKELKPSGVSAPIWRENLLIGNPKQDKPIFITEGIYDAMSITALLDMPACALCGASGKTRLLQFAAHTPKDVFPEIVLSLDADEAGKHLTDDLSNELTKLGIKHSIAPSYPNGCKDANEWLKLERDCSE